MKIIANIVLLIISTYLFSACEVPMKKETLYGTWQAVAVTEEGDSLALNPAEIKLSFAENKYEFMSTLNYKEAGTYQLQSNLLLTKDTTRNNLLEKGVEITKITTDSLFIRMNEQGRERKMILVKSEE